jgi:hypothetical protein
MPFRLGNSNWRYKGQQCLHLPGQSVQRYLLSSKCMITTHTHTHTRTHYQWFLEFISNQESLANLKYALRRQLRRSLKCVHVTRMRTGYFTQDVITYLMTINWLGYVAPNYVSLCKLWTGKHLEGNGAGLIFGHYQTISRNWRTHVVTIADLWPEISTHDLPDTEHDLPCTQFLMRHFFEKHAVTMKN